MFIYNQVKLSNLEETNHYYLVSINDKNHVTIIGIVVINEIIKESNKYKITLQHHENHTVIGSLELNINEDENDIKYLRNYDIEVVYLFFRNLDDISQLIHYVLDKQFSSIMEYDYYLKPEYKIYTGDVCDGYNILNIRLNDIDKKTIHLVRTKKSEHLRFDYIKKHIFIKDKYLPKNNCEKELYIEQLINFLNNDSEINIAIIFSDCDIVYNSLINSNIMYKIHDEFELEDIYDYEWILDE